MQNPSGFPKVPLYIKYQKNLDFSQRFGNFFKILRSCLPPIDSGRSGFFNCSFFVDNIFRIPNYIVDFPHGKTRRKSLELKDKHPLFKDFGGLHHIYANDIALPALKAGKEFPDGSMFVFDLFDVKSDATVTAEASRKIIGVMYKNRNAFTKTAGWGFEGFKGDSRERAVAGKHEACFGCHATEQATDYIFSKYRN